jgi:hypothetical protein
MLGYIWIKQRASSESNVFQIVYASLQMMYTKLFIHTRIQTSTFSIKIFMVSLNDKDLFEITRGAVQKRFVPISVLFCVNTPDVA